jgi:hypothetical protein
LGSRYLIALRIETRDTGTKDRDGQKEKKGKDEKELTVRPGVPFISLGVAPTVGTSLNGIVAVVTTLGTILSNGTKVGFVDANAGATR